MKDILVVCVICSKQFVYNRSNRRGNTRSMCSACLVAKTRRNIKLKAVEYKGGKCIICGYNKCVAALDFHHIDPTTKSFGISVTGNTRSWEKVKQELDKCALLCSNCHREVESGFTNLLDFVFRFES